MVSPLTPSFPGDVIVQVEFTPVSMRVGEVLEKIVTPAIRCLSDFKQLRGCDLFGFSSLDGPSGRRGMNSEMQRKVWGRETSRGKGGGLKVTEECNEERRMRVLI